jgi:hypothetical protein
MATLFSQIIDERGRRPLRAHEFTEAMKNAPESIGSGGGRFRAALASR